jgi:(p)ppGpp synthase/HD superfamily hydrolase
MEAAMPGADVRPDFLLVEQAFQLAADQHCGQRDKAGKPYIWHVIRVALHMDTEQEQIVALLHDVVEDSATTLGELQQMFGTTITDAIDHLTRRAGESYPAYIERLKSNALARKVKLADLNDNMNQTRLDEAGAVEMARMYRYLDAVKVLEAVPNE